MTTLHVLHGAATYTLLVLMLGRLARAPHNLPLRAITVMIACWAASFTLGRAVAGGIAAIGLDPIETRLAQHLVQILGGYCLIAFYLCSALDAPVARRQAIRQAVPLAAAAVLMTVAAALIPAGLRDAAAVLPSADGAGPVGVPAIALLYLTVNGYLLYAFSAALLWTRRYAVGADPRLRRGLALTSVGLAGVVVALAIFIAANLVRWTGGTMPRTLVMVGILAVLCGLVLFLAGMAYPAVGMRLAALRIWWQHRALYRRLCPLWTLLHREFPEDTLNRMPISRWRDTFGLAGVHRRYYRRVIECRDGLVRVSPYLAPFGELPLARRLRGALAAHAAGVPAPTRAIPVAVPRGEGLDADVRELVALSDALGGTQKGVPRSTGLGVTGSTEPSR
ncbi:MAG TPA: MAB_1171c family putative transporter [Actinophytocola sp.]|uniref:MAB_1171c family putative transporter n=1 Tax=Actinophytocola sp. TaxID=1872138 RepID=UPI002DB98501|nr:MAB_1171c family putative transporter [Actinophytocola sp.]HEU5471432.1 MAB_1171c family putative transporter [Actinophytocola sp.]